MANSYWNDQVGNIKANKSEPPPPAGAPGVPPEKVGSFEEVNVPVKVKEGL